MTELLYSLHLINLNKQKTNLNAIGMADAVTWNNEKWSVKLAKFYA